MWITRRTDYATRAVLALALADDDRPRKIHDIAEPTSTPVTVLEQVLPQLRSAGIVRSERGRRRLPAQPPGRGDHPGRGRAVDPGPAGADRLRDPQRARAVPDGDRAARCATVADVRDATIAILDATTFADLAARAGGRWTKIEDRADAGEMTVRPRPGCRPLRLLRHPRPGLQLDLGRRRAGRARRASWATSVQQPLLGEEWASTGSSTWSTPTAATAAFAWQQDPDPLDALGDGTCTPASTSSVLPEAARRERGPACWRPTRSPSRGAGTRCGSEGIVLGICSNWALGPRRGRRGGRADRSRRRHRLVRMGRCTQAPPRIFEHTLAEARRPGTGGRVHRGHVGARRRRPPSRRDDTGLPAAGRRSLAGRDRALTIGRPRQ